MKKVFLLILASFLSFAFGVNAEQPKHCFTDEVYRENLKLHPEILQRQAAIEAFTKKFKREHNPATRTASVIYIIPVVFHIIHEYGPENISDAQVQNAIQVMNTDYSMMNADTANVISDFVPLIANIGFEFRLATIDPNGNCTNGIDRIYSYQTHIGGESAKLDPWPNDQYLNIWTVAEFGASHAGAAAYAYVPGTAPSSTEDGVISLASYVGSIGTSSPTNSRTLTHEVGHCFNLKHPWGSTNQPGVACGDDGVNDTPITKGWDHCPNYPLDAIDICNAGVHENYQNYMDYSYCDCMFTIGQKARMIAAANLTNPDWNRANLWSAANLTATGTDGSSVSPCAPVADFYPVQDHFCSGDSIQFKDASFNTDTVSNYLWSFPSGSPSTSTLRNPSVMYSAAGPYNVMLTVSNPYGSDSVTKNSIVTSFGSSSLTPPYFDDFETPGTFPGTGYIINDGGNGWQRITSVGYSGTACLRLANYYSTTANSQANLEDSWVTPAFNLNGYSSPVLTFRLAYARKDTTKTDYLKVYLSNDCGKTWGIPVKTYAASSLATTANATGSFTPSSTSQWALKTVSGAYMNVNAGNKSNVRFKFLFISGGDNNVYIDDINLVATPMGIDETRIAALNFDVYPNPSAEKFNISFEMPASGNAEIMITDMIGREIKTVAKDWLAAGSHEYLLNAHEFSKGIYLVSLRTGNLLTVKKLVVE